jgi:uncharacterized SAM-binding protein YcdF (DUF218 family)
MDPGGLRDKVEPGISILSSQATTRRPSSKAPVRRSQGRRPVSRRARIRTGPKWRTRAILVSAALIVVLVAWAMLARAFAPSGNTPRSRFDAIIVLGSPADSEGNPTPAQLARVTEAVREYERGVAPQLIVTGGATNHGFVEAQVMARTAEAMGVPTSSIYQEPQARNTIQNACYAERIMREHGWRSAEVVSAASHLPRAGLIFSRTPLEWRTHAAPSLEPEGGWSQEASTGFEVLKTLRYLVYAQWADRCTP